MICSIHEGGPATVVGGVKVLYRQACYVLQVTYTGGCVAIKRSQVKNICRMTSPEGQTNTEKLLLTKGFFLPIHTLSRLTTGWQCLGTLYSGWLVAMGSRKQIVVISNTLMNAHSRISFGCLTLQSNLGDFRNLQSPVTFLPTQLKSVIPRIIINIL